MGLINAMNDVRTGFEQGCVSRELIDSTLAAYDNSCAEMRSETRDAYPNIEMNILQTMNNT